MKKDFHDGTYRVLGILLILSFCVTAVDILPLCYAVRTALAAATLGYVSWLRVKKPELAAECHLAYLQYFWATAAAFCLWSLVSAAGVPMPKIPVLGIFALFPIISQVVIWKTKAGEAIAGYQCLQLIFFSTVFWRSVP